MRSSFFTCAASILLIGCLSGCGSAGATAVAAGAPAISTVLSAVDIVPLNATASVLGDEFTLSGTDFGTAGDVVTVTFTASAGTPFLDGSTDQLAVNATVISSTVIEGRFPFAGVAAQTAVGEVTVEIVGGSTASIFMPPSPQLFFEAPVVVAGNDTSNGDAFGFAVAIDGDTAVVGAPALNAAYVFVRGGGIWLQQDKLVPSDPSPPQDDAFGTSVAVSGDLVVVGSPFHNDNGRWSGSAYVFVRVALAWTEEQELFPADPERGDRFGHSVGISGDTAVVGSIHDGDAASDQGAAYVFVRVATVWNQQQKLEASDPDVGDFFGWSVAIDGDTIVAGAYQDDDNGPRAGSAYVFVRAATVWTEQQKLLPQDGESGDWFGYAVAISNDTVVVGASQKFGNPGNFMGAAYVFVRTGVVWSQEQKLLASDGTGGDNFGYAVGISGDTIVVGKGATIALALPAAVYVFTRSGAVWTEQLKLDGPAGVGEIGRAVAISGDTAIVGGIFTDVVVIY